MNGEEEAEDNEDAEDLTDSDSDDSSDELYRKFLNGSLKSDSDSGESFVLKSGDESNDSDTDSGSDVSKELDEEELRETNGVNNVEAVVNVEISGAAKLKTATVDAKNTENAENTENVPPLNTNTNTNINNESHPKQGKNEFSWIFIGILSRLFHNPENGDSFGKL